MEGGGGGGVSLTWRQVVGERLLVALVCRIMERGLVGDNRLSFARSRNVGLGLWVRPSPRPFLVMGVAGLVSRLIIILAGDWVERVAVGIVCPAVLGHFGVARFRAGKFATLAGLGLAAFLHNSALAKLLIAKPASMEVLNTTQ